MTTLTDFLLARIAEDEALARVAGLGPHWDSDYYSADDLAAAESWHVDHSKASRSVRKGRRSERAANAAMDEAEHIARHDPARVLAECESKRRIVEWCHNSSLRGFSLDVLEASLERNDQVLRLLALSYASHPDYREEWRP